MNNANRRQFLKGTAATVAATSIGVSKAFPATSLVKTISHGEFSNTVLSDGHLTIPTRFLARNVGDADIKTAIGLASYIMSTAEFEFWMAEDVAARLPEDRRNFAPGAQRNLTSVRDRLYLIAPGADIARGIRAIDTAGTLPDIFPLKSPLAMKSPWC
jgi:hypothetical protein